MGLLRITTEGRNKKNHGKKPLHNKIKIRKKCKNGNS